MAREMVKNERNGTLVSNMLINERNNSIEREHANKGKE